MKAQPSTLVPLRTLDPSRRSIMLSMYHHEYKVGTWVTEKTKESLDRMLDHASTRWIAYEAEAAPLIGFAVVTGPTTDPLLEDLIVHPNFRDQGIGARLVRDALEQADTHMDTYCREAIQGFYQKLGFVPRRKPIHGKALLRWTRARQAAGEEDARTLPAK